MRWRLVAVFVAIIIVVLAAHDIPLAGHLRTVERDRLVTGLERDAFVIAGRAEETLQAEHGRGDAALQGLIDTYRNASGARVVITDRLGVATAISDEEVATVAVAGWTRVSLGPRILRVETAATLLAGWGAIVAQH